LIWFIIWQTEKTSDAYNYFGLNRTDRLHTPMHRLRICYYPGLRTGPCSPDWAVKNLQNSTTRILIMMKWTRVIGFPRTGPCLPIWRTTDLKSYAPWFIAPRIQLKDGRYLAYKKWGGPKEYAKQKIIYLHGFGSPIWRSRILPGTRSI
jgi:hypothetical protein